MKTHIEEFSIRDSKSLKVSTKHFDQNGHVDAWENSRNLSDLMST